MTRPRGALLLWFVLLLRAAGNEPALPYAEGERLTYHFYWGPFMVGRGTFAVARDPSGDGELLTVRVHSNALISSLYPVDDLLTSHFDPRRLRSTGFEQNRHEGQRHVWEATFFFEKLRRGVTQSYIGGESKWFAIPSGAVQDKLSTIYFMRHQDWRRSKEQHVLIGNDKKNQPVRIRKLATETVYLDDFPPLRAFQAEPNTEYMSSFVKGASMIAWVSDDERKIPLKVVARISVGTVSAQLVQVEGVGSWPRDAIPPKP